MDSLQEMDEHKKLVLPDVQRKRISIDHSELDVDTQGLRFNSAAQETNREKLDVGYGNKVEPMQILKSPSSKAKMLQQAVKTQQVKTITKTIQLTNLESIKENKNRKNATLDHFKKYPFDDEIREQIETNQITTQQDKSEIFGFSRIRQIDTMLDSDKPELINDSNDVNQSEGKQKEPMSIETFNKKMYMQQYAINFELPMTYVLNARVFMADCNYIYQVIKCSFPDQLIQTIRPVKEQQEFRLQNSKTYLILQQRQENENQKNLLHVGEKAELKDIHNNLTTFSPDGSMFAYLAKSGNALKAVIVHSEGASNPDGILQAVHTHMEEEKNKKSSQNDYWLANSEKGSENQPNYDLSHQMTKCLKRKIQLNNQMMLGIQTIKFDLNNRFLIGYQGLFIFVLCIESRQIKLFELPSHKFEKILNITFDSFNGNLNPHIWKSIFEKMQNGAKKEENMLQLFAKDDSEKDATPRMFVAMKRRSLNQIHVFDWYHTKNYFEHIQQNSTSNIVIEKELIKFDVKDEDYIMFNYKSQKGKYESDHHEHLIVNVSRKAKQIMFSNGFDQFVIERGDNGQIFQFKQHQVMPHTQHILYVEEDLLHKGFMFVTSEFYDSGYRVYHTHQPEFYMKFERRVERESVKFFDLLVSLIEDKDDTEKKGKLRLTLLGHDSSEFIIDQASFVNQLRSEKEYRRKMTSFDIQKAEIMLRNSKLSQVKTTLGTYGDISAFSLSWPLVSFANRLGQVFLVNATRRNIIQVINIEKQPKGSYRFEYPRICKTFIAPNKRLFILVLHKGKYRLYCADLDCYNQFKQEVMQKQRLREQSINTSNDQSQEMDTDLKEITLNNVPIIEYPESDVKYEEPTQIYIRDMKQQKRTGEFKRLFYFALHGKKLYSASSKITYHQQEAISVDSITSLAEVDEIGNNRFFTYDEDHIIYLMKKERKRQGGNSRANNTSGQFEQSGFIDEEILNHDIQEVVHLQLNYMSFEKRVVFVDSSTEYDTVRFSFDAQASKLIMVRRRENIIYNRATHKYQYRMCIYDLKTNKTILDMPLEDPVILGIFLSGYFVILNGHMYVRNSIMKIRYDYIERANRFAEQKKWLEMSEKRVFDVFEDMMDLREGYSLSQKKMMNASTSHRLGFISQDTNMSAPCLLTITPYLHERRVYLGNSDDNPQNFITAIRIQDVDRQEFNENLIQRLGLTEADYHVKNGKNSKKDWTEEQKKNYNDINCLVRLDLNSEKMYVYSTNGMMLKRVNYEKETKKYGRPITVSSNGQIIVFTSSLLDMNVIAEKSDDGGLKKACELYFQVSLLRLTPFGFIHLKDIDFYKNMIHFAEQGRTNVNKFLNKLTSAIQQFIEEEQSSFESFVDMYERNIIVNDAGDVCLQMHVKNFQGKSHQLIVFEDCTALKLRDSSDDTDASTKFANTVISSGVLIRQRVPRWVYVPTLKSDDTGESGQEKDQDTWWNGCTMNNDYLILWNKSQISYVCLENIREQQAVQEDFNEQKKTFRLLDQNDYEIKFVRTSPHVVDESQMDSNMEKNANRISICACYGDAHYVFMWDINNNLEMSSTKVEGSYTLLYDEKGNEFIVQPKQVIMSEQSTKTTVYDIDKEIIDYFNENMRNINVEQNDYNNFYGLASGVKCDYKHKSWMILNNYIALPYCYMSFMLSEAYQREHQKMEDNVFDLSAFNYIFNNRTSIVNLMKTEFCRLFLPYILEQMYKEDKNSIGIIAFNVYHCNDKTDHKDVSTQHFEEHQNMTALHIAFSRKDTPNVEILLKYLSMTERNSSFNIRDIMPQLIDYQNFPGYLQSLLQRTTFMSEKTVYSRVVKESKKSFGYQLLTPEPRLDQKIIMMAPAPTLLISKDFYDEDMLENSSRYQATFEGYEDAYYGHPVNIEALDIYWMVSAEYSCQGKRLLDEIYSSGKMTYYKLTTIQLIIQYVYGIVLEQTKRYFLPNVIDLVFTVAQIAIFDDLFSKKGNQNIVLGKKADGTDKIDVHMIKTDQTTILQTTQIVIAAIQICLAIYELYRVFRQMHPEFYFGKKRMAIINGFIQGAFRVAPRLAVSYISIELFFVGKSENPIVSSDRIRWLRYWLALAFLIQIASVAFYLQMIEMTAQLLDLVKHLIKSVLPLVGITLLFGVPFFVAFLLIGQNQIQFEIHNDDSKILDDATVLKHAGTKDFQDYDDHVRGNAQDRIQYRNAIGSLFYVFNFLLGNADDGPFWAYDNAYELGFLYLFYTLAGFAIMVLLLNMIIAIMSDAQAQRTAEGRAVIFQSKLKFALDNWHYVINAETDNPSNYIIGAISKEAENDNNDAQSELMQQLQVSDEKINLLQSQLKEMGQVMKEVLMQQKRAAAQNI